MTKKVRAVMVTFSEDDNGASGFIGDEITFRIANDGSLDMTCQNGCAWHVADDESIFRSPRVYITHTFAPGAWVSVETGLMRRRTK